MYEFVFTCASSPLTNEGGVTGRFRFHLRKWIEATEEMSYADTFDAARKWFKSFLPGVQIETISRL